jgi:hypothetical protein
LNKLGISIRGGIEYGLGVFISRVEPNSVADTNGLKVCDQIIDVNGQKFSRISHQDAELILKTSLITYKSTSLPIKITVRYLSKLPVLDSSLDTEIVRESPVKNLNEELSVLNKDETFVGIFKSNIDFVLFKHYLGEYLIQNINIQYLLFLILNRVKLNKKVSFNLQKRIYLVQVI